MSSRKRKKYSKDIKCVFFPDDVESGVQNVRREASALSSASSAKSWEKCGESFLETPVIKSLDSFGRTPSVRRKLAQGSALVQTSAVNSNEHQVHIAWSSSDSDQSDNETEEQRVSRVVALQQHCLQKAAGPMGHIQSYSRALRMLSSDKDDLPIIDTDSDFNESEENAEKDGEEQISDCESESSSEKPQISTHTNVAELETSGYVSHRESVGDTMSSSRLDCKSLPSQTGEGSRRSVSDWVKSAQAMLQTPQKSFDRQIKTPEDSAKKKRKFQRFE